VGSSNALTVAKWRRENQGQRKCCVLVSPAGNSNLHGCAESGKSHSFRLPGPYAPVVRKGSNFGSLCGDHSPPVSTREEMVSPYTF
jgi:hypothetical protein